MNIEIFPLGPIDTNAYLLSNEATHEAVLIDAPFGSAEAIPQFLNENRLTLKAVLLTHGHWDHIGDAGRISKQCKVPIIAAKEGKELIEDPTFQQRYLFASAKLDPMFVEIEVGDGDKLEYAGFDIKCIAVNGHCPGSIAYIVKSGKQACAFVGDLIFEGSVGRTDLWGGDFATLEKSVKKIYALPDDTVIYPGHGESTTVGAEKASNPYVRA